LAFRQFDSTHGDEVVPPAESMSWIVTDVGVIQRRGSFGLLDETFPLRVSNFDTKIAKGNCERINREEKLGNRAEQVAVARCVDINVFICQGP